MELLDVMRKFGHDAEEMVLNTPTAAELKKLYDRPDTDRRNRIEALHDGAVTPIWLAYEKASSHKQLGVTCNKVFAISFVRGSQGDVKSSVRTTRESRH